jgi:hypothetical protein
VPAETHPIHDHDGAHATHCEVFQVPSPCAQVVCGNRAGTWTVLLDQQGHHHDEQLQGEMKPSFIISAMHELIPLLEEHFDLQPPLHAKTVVMQEATAP